MRNWRYGLLLPTAILAVAQAVAPAYALPISPSRIGWQAALSRLENDVSGTVTIVDEDTLRIDDFTYNGRGKRVHWMLGIENTEQGFIDDGIIISESIRGKVFDGTQGPIFLDLPDGVTIEGYHSVSVFCTRVLVNFGSGVFRPVPEPTTLSLCGIAVLGLCMRRRRS